MFTIIKIPLSINKTMFKLIELSDFKDLSLEFSSSIQRCEVVIILHIRKVTKLSLRE